MLYPPLSILPSLSRSTGLIRLMARAARTLTVCGAHLSDGTRCEYVTRPMGACPDHGWGGNVDRQIVALSQLALSSCATLWVGWIVTVIR